MLYTATCATQAAFATVSARAQEQRTDVLDAQVRQNVDTATGLAQDKWTNHRMHRSRACAVLRMDNQLSRLGDAGRTFCCSVIVHHRRSFLPAPNPEQHPQNEANSLIVGAHRRARPERASCCGGISRHRDAARTSRVRKGWVADASDRPLSQRDYGTYAPPGREEPLISPGLCVKIGSFLRHATLMHA